MNKTFAFLTPPLEPSWVRRLKFLRPFKIAHIRKIRSGQGKEIDGYLIFCPLLPDKIISAGHIAERLGAKILGLGGYTSIAADNGYSIAKNLKIPITNGSTLTAWAVFEAIYRASRINKLDLRKSTLAVIGATEPVGNLCVRKLSEYVPRIVVSAPNTDKLGQMKETLLRINSLYADPNRSLEIIIEEDVHKALKDADIVIIAAGYNEQRLDISGLKTGGIICDVSIPKNIAGKTQPQNKNITVIEGGLIKIPYPLNIGAYTGLPGNIIHASLAETMLLTFEEKFVNYSLGDTVNLDQMEEIADIGVQHGFEVWLP